MRPGVVPLRLAPLYTKRQHLRQGRFGMAHRKCRPLARDTRPFTNVGRGPGRQPGATVELG